MATMNSPSAPQQPKLLDRIRLAIRAHHYSRSTEDAYVAWIKRYIFIHGKRHPVFLSSLALDGRVAACPPGRNRLHTAAAYPGTNQDLHCTARTFAIKGMP